jgi:hypothetical protein
MADLRSKRTAEVIQLIIPVSEIRKLVLKTPLDEVPASVADGKEEGAR